MAIQEHDEELSCNKNGRFTSHCMSMKYTKEKSAFPLTGNCLEASVLC